ncbi:YbaB/EbfC family nucleoid-associated protein [Glycomyces niveus]|uniref:YbaB/EbfC family nucleoid-associated protein n=1 Tax=Glycomyces niveus TaxID=2820287 RepID=A0ABS3UA14_9ACTN|nr:YbaB/EbfC family nucleoid-associated protein [Glycomyces sp. NEAU-S30]MBO3735621.1 YbaB/EbfC family nucleoid-associated protein [Glycomyces sp. NEAU-S30]
MDAQDFPATAQELREIRERNWNRQMQEQQALADQAIADFAEIENVYAEHADEYFTGRSPQGLVWVTVGIDRKPVDIRFQYNELWRRVDREIAAEEITAAFRDAQKQANDRRDEIAAPLLPQPPQLE